MKTQDVLKQLRENNNLTQDQMAERVMVTRQAVSRWELVGHMPNPDNLKEEERRTQYDSYLSQLKHWRKQ
ncbi:MAG: helix-turn-helix domain-containing protein [Lachnospiraceae bacterium]